MAIKSEPVLYTPSKYQEVINALANMGTDLAKGEPMEVEDNILAQFKAGYAPGMGTTILNYGNKIPFEHQTILQGLQKMYPNLQEITVHDKPGYDSWIFRLKFDGTFYEAHIPRSGLRQMSNQSAEIIFWLRKFIDENIKGVAKEAVKKRDTISKKQRELKKDWLL